MTLTTIKPAGLSKPVDLADNEKIRLGTGNDLEIFHGGSNSVIAETGTGNLELQTNSSIILQKGNSEFIAKFISDGACELYYDGVLKLDTTASAVRCNDNLIMGNHHIELNDNSQIMLGNAPDMRIYHDGSHSFITATTGDLTLVDESRIKLRTNQFVLNNHASDESIIYAAADGEVSLYHNGSKKFDTTSLGISITGGVYPAATDTYQLGGGSLRWNELNIKSVIDVSDNGKIRMGNGDDLQIYHDASGPISYIKNTTNGYLYIQDDVGQNIYIRATPNENAAVFKPNGAVELFYDNSKKLETTSTGSQGTGILKLISGNGSQASDFSCLHIVAGGTADRGLKIGTGRATGASQNDGAVFYDAINSESNEYGSQHIFRRGGHNNMVIGYQSNNYVGIQQDAPGCALHVTDTNPVIAAFHRSNGSSSGDQARISLGALQNNPPYQRGVNLVAEYKNTGHDFIVQCSPNDSSGPAEKTRVLAGGGLTFNGDTAAANALDDYEEGTFTPSSAQVTLTGTISGHYTKIGDLVTVQCIMVVPTTTNSSDIEIDGLPFNAKNGTDGSYIQGGCVTYHNQGGGPYTVLLANNMNRLVVYQANGQRQTFNQFSGKNLRLMATYKVA